MGKWGLPHRRGRVEHSCSRGILWESLALWACVHARAQSFNGERRHCRLHRGPPAHYAGRQLSPEQLSFLYCSTHTHRHPRAGCSNPKPPSLKPGASASPSQFSHLQNGHQYSLLRLWEDPEPTRGGPHGLALTRQPVSHRDSQEGFLDLTNLEPYSSHTAARPSGGRGGCSDPSRYLPRGQLHHGSLPSTSRSHQTSLQLCQVLTANLVATLRPRMQEGGQAGGAVNRGVSFIISCFNFHSAQILHPA